MAFTSNKKETVTFNWTQIVGFIVWWNNLVKLTFQLFVSASGNQRYFARKYTKYVLHKLNKRELNAGLNTIFLSADWLSGKNDLTSDKANFRPDIRQKFLKKIKASRVCVALKAIWTCCTSINMKLNIWPSEYKRTSVVFKEHSVLFSLTFLAYALKLKLYPNISISITKN